MKENLIHSRTCVYNINYHVVWSVKYRRKILSAEIEIYLKELVQKIASDKGFTVHLFEVGEGDHIHCFVSKNLIPLRYGPVCDISNPNQHFQAFPDLTTQ